MFKYPILSLATTAYAKSQLLNPEIPQVALVGRSNVGKSSLLNALAERKQLAKTSSTPGKTRSINFYTLQDDNFDPENLDETAYIVDLPGYGYAKCSKAEREAWAELIEYYLANTTGLRAMVILVDSRHEAQNLDRQMAEFAFAMGLPIILVLTKIDRAKAKDRNKCLKSWKNILGNIDPILTSAEKKEGIEELWKNILYHLSN